MIKVNHRRYGSWVIIYLNFFWIDLYRVSLHSQLVITGLVNGAPYVNAIPAATTVYDNNTLPVNATEQLYDSFTPPLPNTSQYLLSTEPHGNGTLFAKSSDLMSVTSTELDSGNDETFSFIMAVLFLLFIIYLVIRSCVRRYNVWHNYIITVTISLLIYYSRHRFRGAIKGFIDTAVANHDVANNDDDAPLVAQPDAPPVVQPDVTLAEVVVNENPPDNPRNLPAARFHMTKWIGVMLIWIRTLKY